MRRHYFDRGRALWTMCWAVTCWAAASPLPWATPVAGAADSTAYLGPYNVKILEGALA